MLIKLINYKIEEEPMAWRQGRILSQAGGAKPPQDFTICLSGTCKFN